MVDYFSCHKICQTGHQRTSSLYILWINFTQFLKRKRRLLIKGYPVSRVKTWEFVSTGREVQTPQDKYDITLVVVQSFCTVAHWFCHGPQVVSYLDSQEGTAIYLLGKTIVDLTFFLFYSSVSTTISQLLMSRSEVFCPLGGITFVRV